MRNVERIMHCSAFCLLTCSSSAKVGEAKSEPADAVVTISMVIELLTRARCAAAIIIAGRTKSCQSTISHTFTSRLKTSSTSILPMGTRDMIMSNNKLIDEKGAKISDSPGMAKPAKIVAASSQHAAILSKFDSILKLPVGCGSTNLTQQLTALHLPVSPSFAWLSLQIVKYGETGETKK